MKTLILTEKREAGAHLAATLNDSILGSDDKALESVSKSKGYLEGQDYLISWAAGHLYTQTKASQLDPSYALFALLDNIEDYKMPKLLSQIRVEASSLATKTRQIKIIKDILQRNDIKEIIVMTDADAEGEAIGRDMLYNIVSKLPTNKITRGFNSGSFKAKESVDRALQEREPINTPKYNRLYDVQQVRSKGDYIVGMKLTKALCDTYGRKLYTGRVKAVVTALIGNREEEIKSFSPKEFYTLTAKKGDIDLKHFFYEESEDDEGTVVKNKQERYYNLSDIEQIEKRIKDVDYKGTIEDYTRETTTSKNRPLPLSGTDFASEMMGQYKIKYKQCNEILDYLRIEGFTTYPGTNGRYFAQADKSDVQVAFVTAKKYFGIEATYSNDVAIFDDKKAAKQNHTPLSVTGKVPTERDLKEWESHSLPRLKEAYDLIAKRILIHFLEADEIEKQSLTVSVNGVLFFISGQKAIKQGWRELIGLEVKNTLFEADYKKGDDVRLESLERKKGQTKRPLLFTEKTLTDIMLNISKVVDEMIKEEADPAKLDKLKKDRKLLKSCEGIGTDRTREQIITDLIDNELIQVTKDGLILTENGKILYDVLPEPLKNPVMTANWENAFEDIRKGERKASDVIAAIDQELMNELVMDIVERPKKEYVISNEVKKADTDVKCPLCGGDIFESVKVYRCEKNTYKDGKQTGCKFAIFKDQTKFFGRAITDKDFPSLFAATKDNPLRENANGIYIDVEDPYFVKTVFAQKIPTPGELIETPKTFKIDNKFVWKSCFFKDLTKSEAKDLLEGKEVALKRKSKENKDYTIKVKLDDSKPGSVIKL